MQDIQAQLKRDFGPEAFFDILRDINEWDAQTKGLLDNRLLRAVIFLCHGDRDEFLRLKELARHRWQAVIDRAEYDGDVRVRDFGRPFGQQELG